MASVGIWFVGILAVVVSGALSTIFNPIATSLEGKFAASISGAAARPAPLLVTASAIQEPSATVFFEKGFEPKSPDDFRPAHLSSIQRAHSAQAGSDEVDISVQGKSNRTITLTGITFGVTRKRVPTGAIYEFGQGGGTTGRYIDLDLDANPPYVPSPQPTGAGSADGLSDADSPALPMTFPWTVSDTDPLTLEIYSIAANCDCRWSASMTWQSGSDSGTIKINDHGKPFRVVSSPSLITYLPDGVDGSASFWSPEN